MSKPLRGYRSPIYYIDDAAFLPSPTQEETMTIQLEPMKYWPDTGKPCPGWTAEAYREREGKTAWLFNPWTGTQRDARDIGSDPFGHLIVPSEEVTVDRSGYFKTLVNRFLAWPLPATVAADGCATNPNYAFPRSGTNLLNADEAEAMLKHVLDNEVLQPQGGQTQQWRRVWEGSGPQRGWHICEGRQKIAYLGDQLFGESVNALIDEHNKSVQVNRPINPRLMLSVMLPEDLTEDQQLEIIDKVFANNGTGVGADKACFERIATYLGWKSGDPVESKTTTHPWGGLTRTTVATYDDGSSVQLDDWTGGAHPAGAWGELTLRFIDSDGSFKVRHYVEKKE
jgi:hypothetical protein